MKKIIIFLFMLLWGASSLQAYEFNTQKPGDKYKVEFGWIPPAPGRGSAVLDYWTCFNVSTRIVFANGVTTNDCWWNAVSYFDYWAGPLYYYTSEEIRGVIFDYTMWIGWGYAVGGIDFAGSTGALSIDGSHSADPCYNIKIKPFSPTTPGGYFDDYFYVKVTPVEWKLDTYPPTPPGTDIILTNCKSILLDANDGYSRPEYGPDLSTDYVFSTCVWEYSIGDSDSWTELDYGVQTTSISASTIPNFSSIVGQNVKVRYTYCDESSNILVLSTMFCGPELVSAEGVSSCGSGNNGQIKLTYSRELYTGEYLNFWVTEQGVSDSHEIHYGWNDADVTKNLGQREITLSGLSPGTYKVRITSYMGSDSNVGYTDASGTYSKDNIKIESKPPIVFSDSNIETTPVHCLGGSNGTITVAASGAGTYYFQLYKNNNLYKTSANFTYPAKGTISGLPAGVYDVKLINSEGCESEIKVVIVDEPGLDDFKINDDVELQRSTYNEDGTEAGNGSITISVTPNSSHRFIWRRGSSTGTILSDATATGTSRLGNISSGTYHVQVINGFGCSINSLIVLPAYPQININIATPSVIACSGGNTGQLQANVTGGTPPYQYSWYKINETTQEETLIQGANSATLSSITAGLYRLRITDSKGSKARSAVITQTEKSPMSASFSTTRLNCFDSSDGFLQISVSGGTAPYTYKWYNGATGVRIENLTAGEYGVTVTDGAGCTKQFTGTVTAPSPLTINTQVDQPACYGLDNGKITLQVSGGNPPYSYTWNDGNSSATRSNLGMGDYSVEVTDSKNCEILRREFTLSEPQSMEIIQVSYQPITQFGLTNGKFSVKISGGSAPYSISCFHSGGQSYSPVSTQVQDDGSLLVNYENLPKGEYTVTATGSNYQPNPLYDGCMASFQITVTEPPLLTVTIRESRPITCYKGDDGALIAEGDGGVPDSPVPYLYEWFRKEGMNTILLLSGQNTLSDLTEGVYVVKVTDKNNVSAFSQEYNLLSPDTLTLNFNINPLTCLGGCNGQIEAIVAGGTGFYTYLWNTGETGPVISQKGAGTYSVTVTDKLGCQVNGSVTLAPPESYRVDYIIRPLSCYALNDGGISLNVQGDYHPYTYLWSTGSTLSAIENLAPGDYSVDITDSQNCTSHMTFTIPNLDPIEITLTELIQPIGFGYSDGSVRFEITGGNLPYHVKWFKDEQELSSPTTELTYEEEKAIAVLRNISEGNYLLRIEDVNYQPTQVSGLDPRGCLNTYSFYMPQPPKLEVEIEQTHIISCYDSSDGALGSSAEGGVPFTTGLAYAYEWEKDGVLYETGVTGLSDLAPGSYRLKITDANGIETYSQTVVITQPDPLALRFQSADIKCSYDSDGWAEVFVTGGTAPYTYEWSTGDSTPRIENISRGKYMVRVTDVNECQIIGDIQVIQGNAIQVDAQLIQPTCFGGSDGAIHITLSKGTPPYSYRWENGQQTLSYTGLSKGTYTFTVNDVHGCSNEVVTYELGEPDKIFVDLGEDRELCKGQTVTIEAKTVTVETKIPEPAKSFTWYNAAQKELFTGATYTLSDAGTYTVKAATTKGCTAYGNVTITRDDREISADFIAASKVPINEEVYMVNIAIPAPESVEWILPETDAFEVITENQQILSMVFLEYGTYTLGMRSYSGNCWETVYKTIQVMNKHDIDNYEETDEPMLKAFTVSPNPAFQRFRVYIELKENSPVDLYLINSGNGAVAVRKSLSGSKVYSEWFEVPGSQQGTYVISLVAPKAQGVQKIILK